MSIFLYFHCIAWLSFAGTIVKVTPKKGKAKSLKATITVKAGKTTKTVKITVVAALSAKQTKAKEITVTSATPVTKDSKISLKRGSVEIALDEKNGVVIDSTTGKTVVLTTAAKLIKGDYTVTIDDKTVDFTAEDEKVSAIEFTSTNTNGFRLNDVVAAVVIYQANAQAVTKSGTFTVSNEAAISEVTIKDGVYNKKGEEITLDEDYDLTKGAYVLVSAKDQYGNAVTSLDWSANKNAIVQIAGGLTNLTAANTTSEEITVAGVKYAGIKLDKSAALGAGNATIIVISNGTGVTAQGTVSVANGVAYSARTAHPFLRNGCAVLAEYAQVNNSPA